MAPVSGGLSAVGLGFPGQGLSDTFSTPRKATAGCTPSEAHRLCILSRAHLVPAKLKPGSPLWALLRPSTPSRRLTRLLYRPLTLGCSLSSSHTPEPEPMDSTDQPDLGTSRTSPALSSEPSGPVSSRMAPLEPLCPPSPATSLSASPHPQGSPSPSTPSHPASSLPRQFDTPAPPHDPPFAPPCPASSLPQHPDSPALSGPDSDRLLSKRGANEPLPDAATLDSSPAALGPAPFPQTEGGSSRPPPSLEAEGQSSDIISPRPLCTSEPAFSRPTEPTCSCPAEPTSSRSSEPTSSRLKELASHPADLFSESSPRPHMDTSPSPPPHTPLSQPHPALPPLPPTVPNTTSSGTTPSSTTSPLTILPSPSDGSPKASSPLASDSALSPRQSSHFSQGAPSHSTSTQRGAHQGTSSEQGPHNGLEEITSRSDGGNPDPPPEEVRSTSSDPGEGAENPSSEPGGGGRSTASLSEESGDASSSSGGPQQGTLALPMWLFQVVVTAAVRMFGGRRKGPKVGVGVKLLRWMKGGVLVRRALEQTFSNELRRRVVVTLFIFLLIRAGYFLPLPFFDRSVLSPEVMGLVTGGQPGLGTHNSIVPLNLFGLNVSPYISASIFISLMVPLLPELQRMRKQSPHQFQELVKEWMLKISILFAVPQSLIIAWVSRTASLSFFLAPLAYYTINTSVPLVIGMLILVLLCGIMDKEGLGGGFSWVICMGILLGFMDFLHLTIIRIHAGIMSTSHLAIVAAFILFTIVGAICLTAAYRKVPIVYLQAEGVKLPDTEAQYIPFFINPAGMQPVLASSILLTLPRWAASATKHPALVTLASWLDPSGNFPIIFYAVNFLLIFASNVVDMSNSPAELTQYLISINARIPGKRPGGPTKQHLAAVQIRTRVWGGLLLGGLTTISTIMDSVLRGSDLEAGIGFTSMLILVGMIVQTKRAVKACGASSQLQELLPGKATTSAQ